MYKEGDNGFPKTIYIDQENSSLFSVRRKGKKITKEGKRGLQSILERNEKIGIIWKYMYMRERDDLGRVMGQPGGLK